MFKANQRNLVIDNVAKIIQAIRITDLSWTRLEHHPTSPTNNQYVEAVIPSLKNMLIYSIWFYFSDYSVW